MKKLLFLCDECYFRVEFPVLDEEEPQDMFYRGNSYCPRCKTTVNFTKEADPMEQVKQV